MQGNGFRLSPQGLGLAVLLCGCGTLDLPTGVIECSSEGACPHSMSCWSDGLCRDAPEPKPGQGDRSLRLEAEDFDGNESLDGGFEWQLVNQIPGAEGNGYMEALPDLDGFCLDEPPLDCGAELSFNVEVCSTGSCDLPPGTYFVHLRGYSENAAEDSVHLGLNDDYVATIDVPDRATYWTWTLSQESITVESGSQQLSIWMREDGARVDAIVVSDSAQQPD